VDHAEERADGELRSDFAPGLELMPCPAVHADLAAATTLSLANDDCAASGVEVGLGQLEGFADPQPGTPQQNDEATQASAVGSIARGAHDRDDLLDGWRVGGIAQTLVPWRSALVVAGHRDR
jgi:hypothetical protein